MFTDIILLYLGGFFLIVYSALEVRVPFRHFLRNVRKFLEKERGKFLQNRKIPITVEKQLLFNLCPQKSEGKPRFVKKTYLKKQFKQKPRRAEI